MSKFPIHNKVLLSKGAHDLVHMHLERLMEALEYANASVNIETVIDPLTRKSRHKVQLQFNRSSPEFAHLVDTGKALRSEAINRSECDVLSVEQAVEGLSNGLFVKHEDAGWLFWATDKYFYRQYRVFDHKVPPTWATQAVYFSK